MSDRPPDPEEQTWMPPDLVAVVVLVVATAVVTLVPVVRDTPVRFVLGLPFVLFLPGYAVIAALFPGTADDADGRRDATFTQSVLSRTDGIGGFERLLLSFGVSLILVPLLLFLLVVTPWGPGVLSVLVTVGGVTVLSAIIGAVRRRRVPPPDRFSLPYEQWLDAVRAAVDTGSTGRTVWNVLFAVTLVLAVVGVGYTSVVPRQGPEYTEFYLLTETGNGALVADDPPARFRTNQSQSQSQSGPLYIGIRNREASVTEYTVVVKVQRVETADGDVLVRDERELQRFRARIERNETWRARYDADPAMDGDPLRLVFLLYRGPEPENATVENSYRETYLWINGSSE